jgi:hypothetical protein
MQAGTLDGTDVDEYILAAVSRLNEAKCLLAVEPLYGSSWHVAFLSQIVYRFAFVATALARGLARFEFWGNRQSDAKRAARPSRFGRSSIANT